jgi:hypothetical protein
MTKRRHLGGFRFLDSSDTDFNSETNDFAGYVEDDLAVTEDFI